MTQSKFKPILMTYREEYTKYRSNLKTQAFICYFTQKFLDLMALFPLVYLVVKAVTKPNFAKYMTIAEWVQTESTKKGE